MVRHPADALFASFQTSGDPRALAQVFDLLASELLLVAAHFARGGAEAEDLLQCTFLAAIEGAQRWDAGRPLMPWLVGILVNQARRERRRLRSPLGTQLGTQTGEVSSPLAADDDPTLAAEAHEFAERAARALAQLPQPYRHVLNLRWVHGLPPLAIAHSLGTSPETVKTQLRRGLDLLRQALPAGFALTSLASLLTAGSGLASVRAAVLAAAEASASLTAAATGATRATVAWAGRASGLWVTLAVFGLGAVALVWQASRRDVATAPSSPAKVSSAGGLAAHARIDATAERSPIASPAPQRVAQRHGFLEIRAVHGADGAAAGTARVRVQPIAVADLELREHLVVLDAVGRARVEVAPGRVRLIADRGGETAVAIEAGETTSATVSIPRGIAVDGVVLDGDGAPVPGASVWISKPDVADDVIEVTHAGADGRFSLRDVEPGRCLSAQAPERACSLLVLITGDAGDEVTCTLRLDEVGQLLSGVVFGDDDQPVADASVMIGQSFSTAGVGHGQPTRPPALWLRTDAEGRFATSSVPVAWATAPLWVGAPGYAHSAQTLTLPSSTPLRVSLRRGATLRARVRTDAGEPAAGVRVEVANWLSDPVRRAPIGPSWRRSVAWTDADGVVMLHGLRPGRARVLASGSEAGRAATVLDLHEGAVHEWNTIVEPPLALRGRLLGEDGRPLAAWRIQLEPEHGGSRARTATTGEDGRFTFGDCDRCAHVLGVFAKTSAHRAPVQRALLAPGEGERDLVVPDAALPSATLCGSVPRPEGPRQALKVYWSHPRQGYASGAVDATGAFALDAIAPGQGTVLLVTPAGIPLWREEITVAAGARHDLGPRPLPATGTLRVLARDAKGAPTALGSVTLHDARDRWFGSLRLEALGGDGVTIAAGRYSLTTGDGLALQIRTVDVEPGRTATVEFTYLPGVKRRITMAHAYDGSDLELAWTWTDQAGEVVGRLATRWTRAPGDASTTWCWLAPGTYDATVTSSHGLRAHARVRVPDQVLDDTPIHFDFR